MISTPGATYRVDWWAVVRKNGERFFLPDLTLLLVDTILIVRA